MTKKQTRLEKVREKNVEIEEFPKSDNRTPIVLEEEIPAENIPKVERYVTKTYLVKDILVGKR